MKRIKLSQTKWSKHLRNASNIEVTEDTLEAFDRWAKVVGEPLAVSVAQEAINKGWIGNAEADFDQGLEALNARFPRSIQKRAHEKVSAAVEHLGPEFAELLDASGAGNIPDVYESLYEGGIKLTMNPDEHVRETNKVDQEKRSESQAKAATSGMTPAQARKELSEMKTNKGHPWHERFMRGEGDVVAYMQQLINIVDGKSGVPNPAAPTGIHSVDAVESWSAKQAAILNGALSGTDYPKPTESASKVLFSVPDDDETEVD